MTAQERIDRLRERLKEGVLICDGAMGTVLSAGSSVAGTALEILNVDNPDVVKTSHKGYVDAGSDIITTNTFQGTRPALERHGLADRVSELNAAGARVAREAAGEEVFVAGDIGPTGKILEPYGDFPEVEAQAAFAEQAQRLAEAGVDLLIIENFASLEEIRLAVAAAAQTGLPVAASMAFDPSGRTSFGVKPAQAAEELQSAGAEIVGANCGTITPGEMVDIIRSFHEVTDAPLLAQPNAGRPKQTAKGVIYPETPQGMADAAALFRESGARIIGGCCGSTKEHIRAIVARLRSA